MLPRLRAALLAPLCFAPAGACDEEDPLADLEEFRAELGEEGRSRVVIARMYQGFEWTLEAAGKSDEDRIKYVCDALGPLYPTYVSGLVRLGHDEIEKLQQDDHKKKRDEMVAVFEGVKKCLRENADKGKRRRPRFDVVLNALHYTAESKGVTNKFKGDKWLMDDVKYLDDLLAPNGYFFDFFSDPFVTTKPKKGEEADKYHAEALAEAIPKIQNRGRFVGGNMLKTFIPKGADFIAFTDRGLFDQVKHVMEEFDGKKIPVLMHVRNDPHCVGSEGRRYVQRKPEFRLERLHQHVRTTLWGYAPGEQLTNEALIREQYRGIRPAPGYPACPDHTEKATLWTLLDVEAQAGITITESFAMVPTAAVSGWYFAHPRAHYFGLGRITRDQVEDYARRKGWDLATAEKWLAPNLGYEAEE